MTHKPLDHARGGSSDRLKHFAEIERQETAAQAGKEMGKHRGYDDKSRRMTEYLEIDRRRTE